VVATAATPASWSARAGHREGLHTAAGRGVETPGRPAAAPGEATTPAALTATKQARAAGRQRRGLAAAVTAARRPVR